VFRPGTGLLVFLSLFSMVIAGAYIIGSQDMDEQAGRMLASVAGPWVGLGALSIWCAALFGRQQKKIDVLEKELRERTAR
jgi:hypothetical protein